MQETRLYKKEDLLSDLNAVGSRLLRKITIYLIGGCAMSLKNLKDFTKDVDVIFTSMEDLTLFENALTALGYERILKTEGEYKQLGASSILRHPDRAGFDLFHVKVCNMLVLSENMIKRATKYSGLGKLSVFLISNEDISLFKGITERPKDIEDISLLISEPGRKFDWNAIKEECENQAEHLKIEGQLFNRFTELLEKYQIRAPILSWLKNRDTWHLLRDVYLLRMEKGLTHEQVIS
ncbi:MAG: hypothetical protein Q7S22_00910 [Candidatus Micrarchaeota archaeon]|nr:hypothetical protein [Candidatus Micrarchaeota archaeon]